MNNEEIYQLNMEYIQINWPSIYNKILTQDISWIDVITVESSQNINIVINGNMLYPQNTFESINQQVEAFLCNPSSFYKNPTKHASLGGFGDIHEKYVFQIESLSPFIKSKSEFCGYGNNLETFPLLIMFGIGSGQHLEVLLSKKDIKNLYIIDEDLSMLKVSLHLVDWRPIFKHFSQPNYKLQFSITKKSKAMAYQIINTIYAEYPYYSHFIPYYTHYNSDLFNDIKSYFTDKIEHVFYGWGFFDDEIISINHSIASINSKIPFYSKKKQLPKNSTVFIIGSGPSIDADIEFIKKHKNNVIIFSNSSSLSILQKYDIEPDFHFEIERNRITADYIKQHMNLDKTKKISFIGLNVIHPDVYKLFGESFVFCRDNDGGSSFLPVNIPELDHCNPTTPNGSISFASHIGFENIYFFGMDLGFKSTSLHHAASSSYYDSNNSDPDNFFDSRSVKLARKTNFDSTIYTTEEFTWTKQRIENCITNYSKTTKYINCSDGVFVEGSISMHSKEIQIKATNKQNIIANIKSNFIADAKDYELFISETKINLFAQKQTAIQVADDIIKILSNKITNQSELFIAIESSFALIVNIIKSQKKQNKHSSMAFSLLRGTIAHMFLAITTHALATQDKEEMVVYCNKAFNIVIEFLDDVKKFIETIKIN